MFECCFYLSAYLSLCFYMYLSIIHISRPFVCMYIIPSGYLSAFRSTCLSVWIPFCLWAYLSICIGLSSHPPLCTYILLSGRLSVCLYVYLPVCLVSFLSLCKGVKLSMFIYPFSHPLLCMYIHSLSARLSAYLFLCMYMYLSIQPSTCLSVHLAAFLSVCVSIYF